RRASVRVVPASAPPFLQGAAPDFLLPQGFLSGRNRKGSGGTVSYPEREVRKDAELEKVSRADSVVCVVSERGSALLRAGCRRAPDKRSGDPAAACTRFTGGGSKSPLTGKHRLRSRQAGGGGRVYQARSGDRDAACSRFPGGGKEPEQPGKYRQI